MRSLGPFFFSSSSATILNAIAMPQAIDKQGIYSELKQQRENKASQRGRHHLMCEKRFKNTPSPPPPPPPPPPTTTAFYSL